MKITRGQATLIADLQARLVDKLDIKIGYAHPNVTILPENVDFIICESEDVDDDEIQLIHKDDLLVEWIDESTMRVLAANERSHDEKVKEFLGSLDNWLTEGVLWFDPAVTREIDGITVSVTKKHGVSEQDAIYDTNLHSPGSGTLYRYGQIAFAAKLDRRFRALKKVIDETWPDDKLTFAAKMHAIQAMKAPQTTMDEDAETEEDGGSLPSVRKFVSDTAKYLMNKIRKHF